MSGPVRPFVRRRGGPTDAPPLASPRSGYGSLGESGSLGSLGSEGQFTPSLSPSCSMPEPQASMRAPVARRTVLDARTLTPNVSVPVRSPPPTELPMCSEMMANLPDITEGQARQVLRKYVDEARARYAHIGADLKRTRVEVTHEAGGHSRHLAGCSEDGLHVIFAPELALMPEASIRAIVHHEFGHAADFTYPARWVMTRDGMRLLPVEDAAYRWVRGRTGKDGRVLEDEYRRVNGGPRPEHMATLTPRMIADWRSRDAHAVEVAADLLAQTALGERIGYAGPCLLQTVGEGIARPPWLR